MRFPGKTLRWPSLRRLSLRFSLAIPPRTAELARGLAQTDAVQVRRLKPAATGKALLQDWVNSFLERMRASSSNDRDCDQEGWASSLRGWTWKSALPVRL